VTWKLVLVALMLFAPVASRAACTVSASGVSFGSYVSGTQTNITGSVTVNCPSGTTYSVALSAGMGAGATVAARSMPASTPTVNYALFRDAARTSNWGQTSPTDTVPGTGTGAGQEISVYARLPAQYPAPASYADTIVATVTGTDTGGPTVSFAVTALVTPTCTVVANNLNFGTYAGRQLAASTSIPATCTNTTAYSVGLGPGQAVGATVTTRRMDGPLGATLAYGLFLNAGHTLNWGITPTVDTEAGNGNGIAQPLTVYGLIPPGQFVTPGSYSDIVAVVLTY
jgi:spore coat protein U-like protein